MSKAIVFLQRTVADLEEVITLRFQNRENALIVECDALRAELLDAHSRNESELKLAHSSGAEAVQDAAKEIAELRVQHDAALQELGCLRIQVKKQAEDLRILKISSSEGTSLGAAGLSDLGQPPQPTRPTQTRDNASK